MSNHNTSIELLRDAIAAGQHISRNPDARCNVNVAILQYAAGMASEADGMLGPRTLHQVRLLLANGWAMAPQFRMLVLAPGPLRNALHAAYADIQTLLDSGRDIWLGLVQQMLGIDVTGLLGERTRAAIEAFMAKSWIGPGRFPSP